MLAEIRVSDDVEYMYITPGPSEDSSHTRQFVKAALPNVPLINTVAGLQLPSIYGDKLLALEDNENIDVFIMFLLHAGKYIISFLY